MTQEDRELLLKDLCGRLPYGVRVYAPSKFIDKEEIQGIVNESIVIDSNTIVHIECCKPYLRPMLSMTKEEYEYYNACAGYGTYEEVMIDRLDFLHRKHFDYRKLIEKGLAIEAPEGMYN